MWVGLEVFPREFNYIIPRSLHLLDTQRAVFNMTPQCRQNALALSSHKAKSFFFRVMHTLKNGTFPPTQTVDYELTITHRVVGGWPAL